DGVPASVLAWLQQLLRERFHDGLVLRQSEPAFCDLFLPGHEAAIRIRSDFAVFDAGGEGLPCCLWEPAEKRWLPDWTDSLPAPGIPAAPDELVEWSDRGGLLHYDILGLAYWMLSRREEVGHQQLDGHERFPVEASHAFRHGYLERP